MPHSDEFDLLIYSAISASGTNLDRFPEKATR